MAKSISPAPIYSGFPGKIEYLLDFLPSIHLEDEGLAIFVTVGGSGIRWSVDRCYDHN